ncbi:MAG: creatininase family protein [Candidatus Korarchaeota archaeon]|nr:creatininase family protein [Thermoproteota archaeon]MCR8462961.1 creatininase family protein [Thermoproteota archaeon]MCR8470410.1 creatininase family protein [Thermoproteota archaeon]MCR8471427.1 creatininase family protein [Thermoproteota archaeon]MCR8473837.1 creatininase family protein [Thermoproteota archaeon]
MHEWGFCSWDEIKNAIPRLRAAILPIGSTEQHAYHLPLITDTISAYKFSLEVAKNFGGSILVLPPVYYGVSEHHMDFPGTITISSETLIRLVCEIANSLAKHGVRAIIIINGHGGNTNALSEAVRKLKFEYKINALLINPWELINDTVKEILESDVWGHACEFETSIMLFEEPNLVRLNKVIDPKLRHLGKHLDFRSKSRAIYPWRTIEFTDTGALGYPSRASREKGERLFSAMLKQTIEAIEEFLKTVE